MKAIMRNASAVALVWLVVFAVPFVVYGAASPFLGLTPPAGSPSRFLSSVAVTKLGTAAAFVAIFVLARERWRGRWLTYAAWWFAMFAASEIGDLIKPGYSAVEASLGILSEAIYAPLSAFALDRMFRRPRAVTVRVAP